MASSYFSHDSNARNSKKLLRLRQAYGAAGYGVYFMLLERLREEGGYTSDRDYDMIAFDLRVDVELIRAVVEDFDLFEVSRNGKTFQSKGFTERMELREIRSQAGRKGASGRWGETSKADDKNLNQKEKKVKRESKKNNGKNDIKMKSDEENIPSQNGSKWQNDGKSKDLPMALNKIKVKRKEIKNKEKKSCVVFTLHDTDIEIPFKRQPDGKPDWTLEVATYAAFQLHMQHAAAETDRLIAYNLMHNKEAASWSAEQWFAAARMWQSKCKEQLPDKRWDDMAWATFVEALYVKLAAKHEYNLMYELLNDYCTVGWIDEEDKEAYVLPTTQLVHEWMERNLDDIIDDTKALLRVMHCKNLFYSVK